MRLDYELTKQDYIDFNIYHIKNSDTIKRSMLLQRYVMAALYLILPFLVASVTDIPLWYWFIAFVIAAVLWVAFYPRYFMSTTVKRISKMLEEGNNKDMLGQHSISLDDEGFRETSLNGESKVSWSGVEKVGDTESHIFIYTSSIMAYIIPKRTFLDENTRLEFLKILNEKLEDKKNN